MLVLPSTTPFCWGSDTRLLVNNSFDTNNRNDIHIVDEYKATKTLSSITTQSNQSLKLWGKIKEIKTIICE